jgi:8-amino-7-oxononanoate synthase
MDNVIIRLAKQKEESLYRQRRVIETCDDSTAIVDGKKVVNFASNDYLNLSQHSKVKQAFAGSASRQGLGSTGSALISGYSKSHARLEQAFAEFLQRDKAILFNSGYHANLGVLTSFAQRNSTIIADKYCHGSLNAGALLSRAKFIRYRHNDLQQADELLIKSKSQQNLLVSESVFSMQGSIANIKLAAAIARKNQTMLIVDDAHGFGNLGKNGRGAAEHFQLSQEELPCLITPLGKAMGSYGAIVSGESSIIEALLQFADTYRYCTALPPAVCDATLTALDVLKKETWRREKLLSLCEFFLLQAKLRNIHLASHDATPIMPIIIGCNEKTTIIQQNLLEKNLFVSCIRPPTVPNKQACIRISLNCLHEEKQIIYLLDELKHASA